MKVEVFPTGPIMVNTYLAYDDKRNAFVVDPGGASPSLLKAIETKNLNLQYIILTHGHGDHIGGVDELLELYPGIKVAAPSKEKELLSDSILNSSRELYGRDIVIVPDVWVSDYDRIQVGDMELLFIETPGHTEGGVCIKCGKYLFSGDTLFRESIGRTDLYGGNYRQILKSIKEKIYTLPDDTIVLPGHMGDTTVGNEKKRNPFVRED